MSTLAPGFRGARQTMVSGQPSASGYPSGARTALGFQASFAHRDRVLSHRAALADLSGARDPDIVASTVCAARIFSERILTVSVLACTGSGARCVGFPWHYGTADRAKTSRLCPAADAGRTAKTIRWRPDRPARYPYRNIAVGPDRAGDDGVS